MAPRKRNWSRHRPVINHILQATICALVLVGLLFLVFHNLHHETVCAPTNLESDFSPPSLRGFVLELCETDEHKKHKLCATGIHSSHVSDYIALPRLLKHCHQSQYGNYTAHYNCQHGNRHCNNTELYCLLEASLDSDSISESTSNHHEDDDDHHGNRGTSTIGCPGNATTPMMMVDTIFKHPTYPIHNSEGISALLPYFCQFILTDLLEFGARQETVFSVEELLDLYTRNVSATEYLKDKSHHDDDDSEHSDGSRHAHYDPSFQPLSSQTPLVDASMIYGTTHERNKELRDHKHGRMKVSFPKHGICANLQDDDDISTGESQSTHTEDQSSQTLLDDYDDGFHTSWKHHIRGDEHHRLQRICSLPPRKSEAPCGFSGSDDDDAHENNKRGKSLFECGDNDYCNDNIGLLAWHTLLLRNHNFWAGYFRKSRPTWDDEMLYQMARAMVIAELQHITYRHLLPALFGEDINTMFTQDADGSKQSGQLCYDSTQDPRPYAELFSVFRMHSMIPEEIYYRNEHHPYQIIKTRSLDTTLKSKHETHEDLLRGETSLGSIILGMMHNLAEEQDIFVTHSLSNVSCIGRNVPFGRYVRHSYLGNIAESVGQDRELGFPTFSNLYWKVNGKKISDWNTFVDDAETIDRLRALYGEQGWNAVDLWAGVISEKHYSNSLFGKTSHKFVKDQFLRSARTDPYFYTQNAVTTPFLSRIFATHPEQIFERNTNISFPKDYRKSRNIFRT